MPHDLARTIGESLAQESSTAWASKVLGDAARAVEATLGHGTRVVLVPGVMTAYGLQYRVRLEAPTLNNYADTLFVAYLGLDGAYLDATDDLQGPYTDQEQLEAALTAVFAADGALSQRLRQVLDLLGRAEAAA
ncbi:MAG: hypothetical protein HZB16_15275 [Armatimonadetes bacterium]|nr:hypothetical protein [Armatimonadota bacterium]